MPVRCVQVIVGLRDAPATLIEVGRVDLCIIAELISGRDAVDTGEGGSPDAAGRLLHAVGVRPPSPWCPEEGYRMPTNRIAEGERAGYPFAHFGREFGFIRTNVRMSQEELAGGLRVSRSTIAAWELGKLVPDRVTIVGQLRNVWQLPDHIVSRLLRLAGHEPLAPAEQRAAAPRVPGEIAVALPVAGDYDPRSAAGMIIPAETFLAGQPTVQWSVAWQTQIEDIRHAVEDLGARVERMTESGGVEEPLTAGEQVLSLDSMVSGLEQTLSAPIVLPTPEDMTVRLVPTMWLERLEEYRDDQNRWYTAAGIAAGAVLGIGINVATGGRVTPAATVLVACLLLVLAWSAWSAVVYQRRAASARRAVIGDQGRRTATHGETAGKAPHG